MKSLTLFIFALGGVFCTSVHADTILYDNGSDNGFSSAATIDGGQSISDSFTLSSSALIDGVEFVTWQDGDNTTGISWSITSLPVGPSTGGGGTVYASGVDNAVSSTLLCTACSGGGTDLDSNFFSVTVMLNAGTYFLTLQSAITSDGQLARWDINNGLSQAYFSQAFRGPFNEASGGDSHSNSFQILGSPANSPEPASMALLFSGLAILGVLRFHATRRPNRGN